MGKNKQYVEIGTREKATLWLRAHNALAEELGTVSSTHT